MNIFKQEDEIPITNIPVREYYKLSRKCFVIIVLSLTCLTSILAILKVNLAAQPLEYVDTDDLHDYQWNEFGCRRVYRQPRTGVFDKFSVTTESPICSSIGRKILERNGSAVDAAIASMLCIGAVNPHSSGIGGSFVAIIYDNEKSGVKKKVETLIARGVTPASAAKNVKYSKKHVGIPGQIKGFFEAWKKYGKLPWNELIQPTMQLLESPIYLGKSLTKAVYDHKHRLMTRPCFKKTFLSKNEIPATFKEVNLKRTLAVISKDPMSFYKGTLAETIAEDVKDGGGILASEDMGKYDVQWQEPLKLSFGKEKTIYALRPPSLGVFVVLVVKVLEEYRKMNNGSIDLSYDMLVKSFKMAFEGISNLDDDINIDEFLLNMTRHDDLKRNFKQDHIQRQKYNNMDSKFKDDEEIVSSHVNVLSSDGSAVSMTSTIGTRFGSFIKGSRTGIVFNNELIDFLFNGGNPVPGKFPKTFMSPLMLFSQGKVEAVIGASGGPRIVTSLIFALSNHLWIQKSLFARIHTQMTPKTVFYELIMPRNEIQKLMDLGYNTVMTRSSAICSEISALRGNHTKYFSYVDSRNGGGGVPDGI